MKTLFGFLVLATGAFAATDLECTIKYGLMDEVEKAVKEKRPIAFQEAATFRKSSKLAQDKGEVTFDEKGYHLGYSASYETGVFRVALRCPSNGVSVSTRNNGTSTVLQSSCAGELPYHLAVGRVQDYDPEKQDLRFVSLFRLECEVK
ncbi:hypothetical protein K2X33_05780 [bacterium]|nr:hypothetical protein [bacterium]